MHIQPGFKMTKVFYLQAEQSELIPAVLADGGRLPGAGCGVGA